MIKAFVKVISKRSCTQLLLRCAAGGGWGTESLQQLVLVLADGRFHEKAALQRAVREAAAERGVMLAFIILDNPAASLLDMQTVRHTHSDFSTQFTGTSAYLRESNTEHTFRGM